MEPTEATAPARELPQYKSHKVVGALKIGHVDRKDDGSAMLIPAEEGYNAVAVSSGYVAKHDPQSGGYFVEYKDGYRSYSPAEPFEEGYVRVGLAPQHHEARQESEQQPDTPVQQDPVPEQPVDEPVSDEGETPTTQADGDQGSSNDAAAAEREPLASEESPAEEPSQPAAGGDVNSSAEQASPQANTSF